MPTIDGASRRDPKMWTLDELLISSGTCTTIPNGQAEPGRIRESPGMQAGVR